MLEILGSSPKEVGLGIQRMLAFQTPDQTLSFIYAVTRRLLPTPFKVSWFGWQRLAPCDILMQVSGSTEHGLSLGHLPGLSHSSWPSAIRSLRRPPPKNQLQVVTNISGSSHARLGLGGCRAYHHERSYHSRKRLGHHELLCLP